MSNTHTHTHTESMTTSDGSVIEERIRVLKERLRQRKEEVKRVQSEQKRKKKAILRQQEEQLKKRLEVGWCEGGNKVLPQVEDCVNTCCIVCHSCFNLSSLSFLALLSLLPSFSSPSLSPLLFSLQAVENKISRTKNASVTVSLSSGTSMSTSQATSTSPTPPPSEDGAPISEQPREEAHTPVEAAGASQECIHNGPLEKTASSVSVPAVSATEDTPTKPVKEELEEFPTPTPSLGH